MTTLVVSDALRDIATHSGSYLIDGQIVTKDKNPKMVMALLLAHAFNADRNRERAQLAPADIPLSDEDITEIMGENE